MIIIASSVLASLVSALLIVRLMRHADPTPVPPTLKPCHGNYRERVEAAHQRMVKADIARRARLS